MRNVWNRDRFLDVVPDMLEKYKKTAPEAPAYWKRITKMRKGSWSMILDTVSGIGSWTK